MNDPYKILGILPNASDDEVKKAYRSLAKKYHPDRYVDSPLAKEASEKMKEINAAYEDVLNQRKNGYSANSGTSGGTNYNTNGNYTYYDDNETEFWQAHKYNTNPKAEFAKVRLMINSGQFGSAEYILNMIPPTQRSAEWYYLMGVIKNKKGWFDEAANYYVTAYRMDPSDPEYQAAYNRIKNQRSKNYTPYEKYDTKSYDYGKCGFLDFCCEICGFCCLMLGRK